MLRAGLVLLITIIAVLSRAQIQEEVVRMKPDKEYDNILVKKLSSEENASAFVIWVKESVKAHKHAAHTENIYVLEGKGKFEVGSEAYILKKGDYVFIPENTVHSLIVTSGKAMKVISIQSPEFLGKDRIFIEEGK